MTYTAFAVPLSQKQLASLANGKGVRLSHAKLSAGGGGVELPLTKVQVSRIAKAIASKKGLTLTLSHAQIAVCAKTGGAIFQTAVARFKDFAGAAAPAAKDLAVNLADQHLDGALGLASGAAGKALGGVLPEFLKPFADLGLQLGSKYAGNQLHALLAGMKRSKNGAGLFLPGHIGHGFAEIEGSGLYAPGGR